MTPSCKECCRYASVDLDVPQPAWTRLKVWFHFKICRACEVYARQLRALHESLAAGSENYCDDVKLTDEARERMRAAMRGESSG